MYKGSYFEALASTRLRVYCLYKTSLLFVCKAGWDHPRSGCGQIKFVCLGSNSIVYLLLKFNSIPIQRQAIITHNVICNRKSSRGNTNLRKSKGIFI